MSKAITPIQINIFDQQKADTLSVKLIADNLQDEATIQAILKDSTTGRVLYAKPIKIVGDEYKNWDGNNEFPFTYAATQLNVDIIKS